MKCFFRILLRFLLGVFLLLCLVVALLYVPFIQQKAVDFALSKTSETLPYTLSVNKANLKFPLNLHIEDFLMQEKQHQDTLLYVDKVEIKTSLREIFKGRFVLQHFQISSVDARLTTLIPDLEMVGQLADLQVATSTIDLLSQQVTVSKISLADTHLAMRILPSTDSIPPDTSSTMPTWRIAVDTLSITRVGYDLDLEEETMRISSYIEQGLAASGDMNLGEQIYQVGTLQLAESRVALDLDTLARNPLGFDPAHIRITDLNLRADSIFNQVMTNRLAIRQIQFKEISGLQVTEFESYFDMDSTQMSVDSLRLRTPSSYLDFDGLVAMNLLDTMRTGNLALLLSSRFSKQDLGYFLKPYLSDFDKIIPERALRADLDMEGSNERITLRKMNLSFADIVSLKGQGKLQTPFDYTQAQGKITIDGELDNLTYIKDILSDTVFKQQLTIPLDLELHLDVEADKGSYLVDSKFRNQEETITLGASYTLADSTYTVDLAFDQVNVQEIMSQLPIPLITGGLTAQGQGFNPKYEGFVTSLKGTFDRLNYAQYPLHGLQLEASMQDYDYRVSLKNPARHLLISLDVNGVFAPDSVTAQLQAQLDGVNLKELQLVPEPLSVTSGITAKLVTDLKQDYQAKLELLDLQVDQATGITDFGDLEMKVLTNPSSIQAEVVNADFVTRVAVRQGIDSLVSQLNTFLKVLDRQVATYQYEVQPLVDVFPHLDFMLLAHGENVLGEYLGLQGIGFKDASIYLNNPLDGPISMETKVNNFTLDEMELSEVFLSMHQEQDQINYEIDVVRPSKNPKEAFEVKANGHVQGNELYLQTSYLDGKNQEMLNLGLRTQISDKDITLSFMPTNPTILYQPLRLNADNYIKYAWSRRIGADFELEGADGFVFSLKSLDSIEGKGPSRLKAQIQDFNLEQISAELIDMPEFSGFLEANLDLALELDKMEIEGGVTLDSLIYDKTLLGDLSTTLDLRTGVDVGNMVDASMDYNGDRILDLAASYFPQRGDSLRASVDFAAFPLKLANAFLPQGLATLDGAFVGKVKAQGSLNKPLIEASLQLKDATVKALYANATYRLDSVPILIQNSMLDFNKFRVMAFNENPLIIDGTVDFRNFDKIMADLTLKGTDVELLNVAKKTGQMLYGRMMFDLDTQIKGPLDLLQMRGNLDILPETNVTYVLMDSPVSAQNRVGELVNFTSFDEEQQAPRDTVQATVSGINMLMTISIAESAVLGVDLSPTGSDRVELIGGGNLAFGMNPLGDMDLTGRYTLSGGYVDYSLPVLPIAKKFNIRSGSYVEWIGDPMDPTINITAFEKIRSSVTEDGQGSRTVTFEPMILIKNKLEDLQISFDVGVSDDLSIQDQLAQMTPEERSKQAMNLIITQQYIGPGTTSKANSNSAINSFIQKEINQFAGSMLKGVDLSVGIDTYDAYSSDGAQGSRTDYSFRFSKTLFNDRFRIIIGASVSAGDEVNKDDNQNFIDDISLEYLFDRGGNRFIKLFHQTVYESVLEGDVIETGLGVVFKRKVLKIRDLFWFSNKKRKEQKENALKQE